MKVYLSGPITRLGMDEARRRFKEAEEACRAKWPGCYVYNPTASIPAGTDHAAAMRLCLHELTGYRLSKPPEGNEPAYDVLVSLNGWQTSQGASLERMVAEWCDIECLDLYEVER